MDSKKRKKSTLNVIVVGCGYFGEKRIQACKDLANIITLVGVVDQDIKRAEKFGKQYSIPFGTKLADFDTKLVDLAIIATPNITHAELVVEALSRKWHVLCEKPLAPSVREAQQIVDASNKNSRFVKTGSNHRFFPSVKKALEIYKRGDIGEILSFRGSIGNNGNHVSKSWFWNKGISGGGTFIDNGCHLLDIARMFMGDFESTIGSISNVYWSDTSVEDIGTGIFTTKNGRQAVISTSWIQWYGYLYFELWGTEGFIIVDGNENNIVKVGTRNTQLLTVYDFSAYPKNSYHEELQYLSKCIYSGTQPEPNAKDGLAVIQMIENVYKSAEKKSNYRV